eukprot:scaffold1903_cov15-Tisochrysis_lutea.AAC.1
MQHFLERLVCKCWQDKAEMRNKQLFLECLSALVSMRPRSKSSHAASVCNCTGAPFAPCLSLSSFDRTCRSTEL